MNYLTAGMVLLLVKQGYNMGNASVNNRVKDLGFMPAFKLISKN